MAAPIRFALQATVVSLALTACMQQAVPAPQYPHLGVAPPVVIDWYSPSGMTFGKGYSTMSGDVEGTCVKGTVAPQAIGTVSSNYDIEIVSNTQDLSKSLGVTTEAAVGFGLFSASAKSSYLQSQESNSQSVYVIVHSEIIGPAIVLSGAHIMKSDEDPGGKTTTLHLSTTASTSMPSAATSIWRPPRRGLPTAASSV